MLRKHRPPPLPSFPLSAGALKDASVWYMGKKECRPGRISSLSIENADAIDCGTPIRDLVDVRRVRAALRRPRQE
jgi:hypothetical protein